VWLKFPSVLVLILSVLVTCADVFHSFILDRDFAIVAVAALTHRCLSFEAHLHGLTYRKSKYTYHIVFQTVHGIVEGKAVIHSGNLEPYAIAVHYRAVAVAYLSFTL